MNKKIAIFLCLFFVFFFWFSLSFASPPPGLQDLNPLSAQNLGDLIDSIATILLYLGMILTPIGILIGGFYMTTGIPSQQIMGKKIIVYSLAIFVFIIITKWVTSVTKDIIG